MDNTSSLLKALRMLRADPSAHDAGQLDPHEAARLSGYFAGFARAQRDDAPSAHNAAGSAKERVLVLYGSETGYSARVAALVAERLRAAGTASEVTDRCSYEPRVLQRAKTVIIVTSTPRRRHSARGYAAVFQAAPCRVGSEAARWAALRCAWAWRLEPRAFPCAARPVAERRAELGAPRLTTRVDCDEPAAALTTHVPPHATSRIAETLKARAVGHRSASTVCGAHDENRPFSATQREYRAHWPQHVLTESGRYDRAVYVRQPQSSIRIETSLRRASNRYSCMNLTVKRLHPGRSIQLTSE